MSQDNTDKKKIIEAILFSSPKPIAIEKIKDVLQETNESVIKSFIEQLRQEYQQAQRSFTISEVAGGFQMCTHPEFSSWIKKFYTRTQAERLSRPSMETLAIIAYRQPITRGEIETIRGVNVEGVLDTLLERRLIKIRGRKDSVGRPIIYGTTNEFLEHFGLNSLDDLPKLMDAKDIL